MRRSAYRREKSFFVHKIKLKREEVSEKIFFLVFLLPLVCLAINPDDSLASEKEAYKTRVPKQTSFVRLLCEAVPNIQFQR